MRHCICILICLLIGSDLMASEPEKILSDIQANNLSLKALSSSLDAQAQSNLANATLSDPELEYALLFGPESVLRHDIGISQCFDYATLSGAKKAYALSENQVLALEYKSQLRDIKLNARQLICEVIYRNALIELLEKRLEHARHNEQGYKIAMQEGEVSGLEYKRIALELLELEGELDLLCIERQGLLSELSVLNGGKEVTIELDEQEKTLLAPSFELWLEAAAENSTALRYVQAELSLAEQKLRLQRSEAVPGLAVGYMAELVPGSNFRGVRIGLSLPLWSSSRKIAAARTGLEAAKQQLEASIAEFAVKARAQYDKVAMLEKTLERYKSLIGRDEALDSLDKAYHSGQLSLSDYYTESANFFASMRTYLTAELQYALAISELKALEY